MPCDACPLFPLVDRPCRGISPGICGQKRIMEINDGDMRFLHQRRREQEVIAGAHKQRLLSDLVKKPGKLLFIRNPVKRNAIVSADLLCNT